jgi:hypothetical protein
MTSKLLEASWSIQNSFMFRVKTLTDPAKCAKWYTKDKQRTEVKLCNGDKGMFVLRNVKTRKGSEAIELSTPLGSTVKDVASVGGYNIRESPPKGHGIYDLATNPHPQHRTRRPLEIGRRPLHGTWPQRHRYRHLPPRHLRRMAKRPQQHGLQIAGHVFTTHLRGYGGGVE